MTNTEHTQTGRLGTLAAWFVSLKGQTVHACHCAGVSQVVFLHGTDHGWRLGDRPYPGMGAVYCARRLPVGERAGRGPCRSERGSARRATRRRPGRSRDDDRRGLAELKGTAAPSIGNFFSPSFSRTSTGARRSVADYRCAHRSGRVGEGECASCMTGEVAMH